MTAHRSVVSSKASAVFHLTLQLPVRVTEGELGEKILLAFLKWKMNTYLLLATLLCAIMSCVAKPDGAPLSACSSLLPIHRSDNGVHSPQQGTSPYTVSVDQIGTNKIRVTISSPSHDEIRGFMLQARSANDRSKFVAGEFTSSEVSQAIDCQGQKQSTLTHVKADVKTQVTTEWTASDVNEDIIFRATVAKDYHIFWEKIDSKPVKIGQDTPSHEGNSDAHSIYDDCPTSNGCLGMPQKCVDMGNCEVLFKFAKYADGIQFEMYGSLDEKEYMAMGLSDDNLMGSDFVTECLRVGSNAELRNSWNEGRSNTGTTELSSDHKHTSVVDKLTTCVWTLPNVTTFNGRTYNLATDKYYVLLAKGPVHNEQITYHTSKMSSQEPVAFLRTSKTTDPVKIHDGSTTEPTEDNRGKTTPPNKKPGSSSSQLSSSLFWVVFFGVFYAGGKNVLKSFV